MAHVNTHVNTEDVIDLDDLSQNRSTEEDIHCRPHIAHEGKM